MISKDGAHRRLRLRVWRHANVIPGDPRFRRTKGDIQLMQCACSFFFAACLKWKKYVAWALWYRKPHAKEAMGKCRLKDSDAEALTV